MPTLWTETVAHHRRDVGDAVIDATEALVAERGMLGVTMSEIAQRTGIGRATLYKYFPDVQAIMRAWHERQVEGHLRRLSEARDTTPADRRVGAVLGAYAQAVRESGGHGQHELADHLHRDAQLVDAERRLHTLLGEVLSEGAATGGIRGDVPPAELAAFCLHSLAAARGLPNEAAVQRLVSLTMDGLREPR